MTKKRLTSLLFMSAALGVGLNASQGCSSGSTRDNTFNVPTDAADDSIYASHDDGSIVFSDASNDTFDLLEAGCATASTDTTKAPVFMEIVLDGSGSMSDDGKWTAAVGALDAVFDDWLAEADPNIGVGLLVFADQLDPTSGSGPYPSAKDIYPAFVNQSQHDALRARIDTSDAYGGTPTYTALSGAYAKMKAYKPLPPLPADGRKVVVLMTDGVPTDGPGSQDTTAASAALNLGAPQGPIKTFSVGIGPFPGDGFGYDSNFMGDLAVAGGTRASPQCDPHATQINNVCHFQITPGGKPIAQLKQDFINAINRIRGVASGCEYAISSEGGIIDPNLINVIWTDSNGKQHVISQDENDGWTYDDPGNPTKVILHGQACGDTSQDPSAVVKILIGCKTLH